MFNRQSIGSFIEECTCVNTHFSMPRMRVVTAERQPPSEVGDDASVRVSEDGMIHGDLGIDVNELNRTVRRWFKCPSDLFNSWNLRRMESDAQSFSEQYTTGVHHLFVKFDMKNGEITRTLVNADSTTINEMIRIMKKRQKEGHVTPANPSRGSRRSNTHETCIVFYMQLPPCPISVVRSLVEECRRRGRNPHGKVEIALRIALLNRFQFRIASELYDPRSSFYNQLIAIELSRYQVLQKRLYDLCKSTRELKIDSLSVEGVSADWWKDPPIWSQCLQCNGVSPCKCGGVYGDSAPFMATHNGLDMRVTIASIEEMRELGDELTRDALKGIMEDYDPPISDDDDYDRDNDDESLCMISVMRHSETGADSMVSSARSVSVGSRM
jgi:hypothetical protein